MKKEFWVVYEERGLLWYHFRGHEIIEAENIAEASKIAMKYAKDLGWKVSYVSEALAIKFKKQLEKIEVKS